MFVHHRTKGIILKKVDLRETDQLFTIYTHKFGRVEILAKSIRKVVSKLKSGMQLFSLSDVEFIQGKRYKTLIGAISIDKFVNLRSNLARLNTMHKISELLDKLVYYDKPSENIWELLTDTLEELNEKKFDDKNLKLIYYYFSWNLFSCLGYRPELYNCSSCRNKLKPNNIFFIPMLGGVVCQDCYKEKGLGISGIMIDPETVKILRILMHNNWHTVSRMKVKNKHLESLHIATTHYSLFLPAFIKID